MSRRGTNIFSLMFKSIAEAAQGKIRTGYACYIFSDKGFTNAGGHHFTPFPSEHNNDRMVSLSRGRGVRNCPLPPGDYVKNQWGTYSVPLSKCNKCEHRLPRLCCAELRRRAKQVPPPEERIVNILGETVQKTKQLLGDESTIDTAEEMVKN